MLPWLREKISLKRQRWLSPRNEMSVNFGKIGEKSPAEIGKWKNYVDYVFRKPQSEQEDDTQKSDSSESTDLLGLRIISSNFGVIDLQVSYFDSGLRVREITS